MTTKQEKTYNKLLGLSTEQAVDALLNWHGEQLGRVQVYTITKAP